MTRSTLQLHRLSLCGAWLLLGGCFNPNDLASADTEGTGEPTTTDQPTSSTSPTTTDDATSEVSVTDPSSGETSTADTSSTDAPDTSGDGSSSESPVPSDVDGDGIIDTEDNCPDVENVDQSDIDADDTGDWCDTELIDDGERLYVPAGVTHEKSGIQCYSGEVRVYGTVTVPSFSPEVSGSGAVILVATGRVWIAEGGRLDASAQGFAGGTPSSTLGLGGFEGSGESGGCGGGPGSCVGQAGSGGGYGGEGGRTSQSSPFTEACDVCSEATLSHCVGAPGPAFGTEADEDISFGSGGGAGGNSCGCAGAGGRGGRGGGGLLIVSDEAIRVDGALHVDGEQPPQDVSICGSRPGGGGGSGGAIALAAPTLEGTGSLSARGGNGGDSPGDDFSTWGWSGGGGGGGRVKLFGGTDGFVGNTDVSGGIGGSIPADENSYAGEAGGDGALGTAAAIPPSFADLPCP